MLHFLSWGEGAEVEPLRGGNAPIPPPDADETRCRVAVGSAFSLYRI
jgi:hypothetical protein